MSVGSSSYRIGLTVNTQKKRIGAEIYINDDKELFEKFKNMRSEIEAELSVELDWRTASKDCRILAVYSGDIKKSEAEWNKYFDWFCEMSIKLLGIIRKYDV